MERKRHQMLNYKNKINCKGTFAEVILLVCNDLCYSLNTELNTFNHSEELKGQKKIKRLQHKTYSGFLRAFLSFDSVS